MLIVKIHGGLGNQLFQYAFAKSLAYKNNTDFKLDIHFFDDQVLRSYNLCDFNIIENIASSSEISVFKQTKRSAFNFLKSKLFKPEAQIVEEKSLDFNQLYFKPLTNAYLSGYWQSEKYFADIKTQIKNEFTPKTPPSTTNYFLLNKIKSNNAISLHIRRGDFEKEETVNKIHGTCSPGYYENAANLIANKLTDPIFYIFSDDISWARHNLKLNYKMHFVDINDEHSAFEDLRLMYNCKHHIIANSTFSWWGAWLNTKPDKIVIAPIKWFNDAELNYQAMDIVPETWIRI
jgi:hypothetical protein